MAHSGAEDRLDAGLRRDLFFGDLALTRRRLIQRTVAVAVMLGQSVAVFFVEPPWQAALWCLNAVVWPFGARQAKRNWRDMQARAASDPDLASDPRLAVEAGKARSIIVIDRALLALQVAVLAALFLAFGDQTVVGVKAYFRPAPPPTVELVDAMLMPPSLDFRGSITVDITGGQVSEMAPYDMNRRQHVANFRAFEAISKYLVAGAPIDLSQPDWLARFKDSWMRPIDLGTRGDFLVLDVDPRTHDVEGTQVAAAVIGGRYLSRKDVRSKLK